MPRALASQKTFKRTFDGTLDRESFRLSLVRALQLSDAELEQGLDRTLRLIRRLAAAHVAA